MMVRRKKNPKCHNKNRNFLLQQTAQLNGLLLLVHFLYLYFFARLTKLTSSMDNNNNNLEFEIDLYLP